LIGGLIVLAIASTIFFSEEGKGRPVDCEIDRGPCEKAVGATGMTAVLDIAPKPVETMKKLFFRIELKKGTVPVTDGDIILDLSMPGMYMAENRVKLMHKGEGKYEGEGVIVRCPGGGRIWKAEVLLRRPAPHSNTRGAIFVFRVEKS